MDINGVPGAGIHPRRGILQELLDGRSGDGRGRLAPSIQPVGGRAVGPGGVGPAALGSWLTSAGAAKAELVHSEAPNDFELALRADAFIARMNSAEIEERRELNTDASRVRLMLEGSTGLPLGSGTLQPQARIGMRQDGGEVDSGFDMELGGGMTFMDRGGTLTIRVHGRKLVLHEESEYDEWGLGGAITVNPGGGGRGRPRLRQPPNRRGSRIWHSGPGGSGTLYALRKGPAVGTARRRVLPVGRDEQRDCDDAARCREPPKRACAPRPGRCPSGQSSASTWARKSSRRVRMAWCMPFISP